MASLAEPGIQQHPACWGEPRRIPGRRIGVPGVGMCLVDRHAGAIAQHPGDHQDIRPVRFAIFRP
jgi:hypothetical protein